MGVSSALSRAHKSARRFSMRDASASNIGRRGSLREDGENSLYLLLGEVRTSGRTSGDGGEETRAPKFPASGNVGDAERLLATGAKERGDIRWDRAESDRPSPPFFTRIPRLPPRGGGASLPRCPDAALSGVGVGRSGVPSIFPRP